MPESGNCGLWIAALSGEVGAQVNVTQEHNNVSRDGVPLMLRSGVLRQQA